LLDNPISVEFEIILHSINIFQMDYFNNNSLSQYLMNSTFLDDKYFIRGKENINLYPDTLIIYVDPDFSTSHEYMVSKIIANDRLKVFLNTEIEALAIKTTNPN
jgi:hypothetical protein